MPSLSKDSRRFRVAMLLSDNKWHSTMEINAVDVGGSEGCRRLRELRKGGLVIRKRRKYESTQYEYQLTGRRTPMGKGAGQLSLL